MTQETIRRQGERLERFRPHATRYDVKDSVVRGLRLRVSPDGSMSWSLWYRSKAGVASRVTLGEAGNEAPKLTIAEARKTAETLRSQVRAGGDPQAELRQTREAVRKAKLEEERGTVSALGRACLDAIKLKPSTRELWERLFRKEIEPAFGRRRAKEITRRELRDWGRTIVRRGAPITANRAHSVLARLFSWGVAEEIIPGSPFIGLPKPAAEAEVSRDRVLSEKELSSILKALDALSLLSEYEGGWHASYVAAAELLFLTGVRRGNVTRARRSEFENLDDPKLAQWTIPAVGMKGARAHVVPLSPAAVAIVRNRLATIAGLGGPPPGERSAPAARREYLFPVWRGRGREGGDRPMSWSGHFVALWKAVADVIHGAPLDDWRAHDARRAVATHLRERFKFGGDVVRALLAHSAPKGITAVYDRSEFLAERRTALDAWSVWLHALRGESQGAEADHGRSRSKRLPRRAANRPRRVAGLPARSARGKRA